MIPSRGFFHELHLCRCQLHESQIGVFLYSSVFFTKDPIYGKQFTTQNLNELPPSLQPEKRAVNCNNDTVVFYSLNSVFSNFHASNVTIEGPTYSCNEQYFQYAKALLFGDNSTDLNILKETDPYKNNSLDNKVNGYRKPLWEQKAYNILKRVNEEKCTINHDAKQALLNTGTRRIGEASPDHLYGTGIIISSPTATDTSKRIGKNWMGQILTEIRDEMNNE